MSNETSILRPDDFDLGMLVTVLNGDIICPDEGCCERYQQLKGVPLLILDICLPFIVCAAAGGFCTHLDVRDCDLIRVTESYANFFGVVRTAQPEAAPETVESPKEETQGPG